MKDYNAGQFTQLIRSDYLVGVITHIECLKNTGKVVKSLTFNKRLTSFSEHSKHPT